jgi:hypothetical protein
LLSFLRRKIATIWLLPKWNEVQHFATAIRHNPFIKAIEHDGSIPTSCFYIL